MVEKNKIIKGDCLEVMKGIPDKSIDMICTDLPYGSTACKWDSIIPIEPLWKQYKRIIKDTGAIVLFGSQPFSSLLISSNLEMFKYEWVWQKTQCTGFQTVKTCPLKSHENILVFSKGTIASGSKRNMKYNPQGLVACGKECTVGKKPEYIGQRLNQEGKKYVQEWTNYPRSILTFPRPSKPIHPTQKPVELLEYLVRTYSDEGDMVLDSTAGSGSLGVACLNTNRNFILIEKDERYYNLIKERLGSRIGKINI